LTNGIVARAENTVKVVASFSILGDMVKNIGGDRVQVTTLVGPDSDVHAYSPTPATARAVNKANLVVVNGLGLEGWMDRLIRASGYKGVVVVATRGIKPLRMKNDRNQIVIDPHAWQDLANGRHYVANIAAALEKVDPKGTAIYKTRTAAYDKKLADLNAWVSREFSSIPKSKRRMITSHDAFGYLAAAYDIDILSPMGVTTESEPSARAVKNLILQIEKEKITAVFVENISDPRLVEQIARESGVAVGGKLYSDALSGPKGPASTYLAMFKNNIANIIAAMRKGLK
jgi:zinc/manganese transport system substrate-binding protein